MTAKTVAVLGASPKAGRYSNKAVRALLDNGHTVYPVHPQCAEIHGSACYKTLAELPPNIDTLTLYVGPARLADMLDEILSLHPKRIIMNPGAESDELEALAAAQNIEVIRSCTLVMLSTKQF